MRTKLAAEQQNFHESTAGFSSLSENLRGGACNARWQWWGLDADITALQLYVPELDAVSTRQSGFKKRNSGIHQCKHSLGIEIKTQSDQSHRDFFFLSFFFGIAHNLSLGGISLVPQRTACLVHLLYSLLKVCDKV